MSEQNLFVSAFQAEFLLKILAGLHISKVQNTKHTGSDSILKVQNSNLKRTEVLNFISKSGTPLGADYDILKSGTPLEVDYFLKKWTELFQRSGTLIRNRPPGKSGLWSGTQSGLKMDPIS
ncbi:hypothetical protein RclHR1_15190001 [Rhizophagus clarus]|uniref:Uncharacterized protein n=1 Tax=Rhizophagus clarus TaxID=94130 RepID=A0A2Z6QV82_9GLOM|nr:hypothetical protein RclHR1_15190001 [Rhizophagus clarus]